VAIVLSAVIALTLSPSLAALVLKDPRTARHGRLYQWSERVWERVLHGYEYSLKQALRLRTLLMLLNLALIAATVWLLIAIPKGFFPTEDTGMIFGFTQGSPDISFMGMADAQQRAAAVVLQDPDVASAGSGAMAAPASTQGACSSV
jgi:multidrug efflux pump subunit AcrB